MKNFIGILKTLYLALSCVFVLMMISCQPDSYDMFGYEDGETDVEATILFSDIPNNLGGTRAAGNAIKSIRNLCVLIYQGDKLVRSEYYEDGENGFNVEQNGNSNTSNDAVNSGNGEHQAESTTPKAKVSIKKLKNGNYNIYAVANMGNIASDGSGYDVTTPEKLKNIKLVWNEDDISANDQMLGYFTGIDNKTSFGFDAPTLIISPGKQYLHAWLKRAASKVTVAVDGSKLNDGVEVYIKSIQIKDIPSFCWLGRDNAAHNSGLIANGEKFEISSDEGQNGPFVSNARVYFYPGMTDGDYKPNPDKAHSENQQALYFYENMQGTGDSKKQVWENQEDKTKPKYPNGNDPNDEGYKDKKRNGTYIEVIGYYKGVKDGNNTEGPIIYRFMLGKDVDKDYNAQRNYHYKLTLNLVGNANDADWHIVYDMEPDVIVPNPYYISYLYDQSMNLPIKIYGKKLISLRADIVENGWHAINEDGSDVNAGANPPVYWNGEPNNPGPWNGFLSLRKTEAARFGVWPYTAGLRDPANEYIASGQTVPDSVKNKFAPKNSITYSYNKTYYDEKNRGWREYIVTEGHHEDTDGNYNVATNGGGEWTVTIPLYTRAAVMVSQTGYTGNNPYVAYRRMAKVKFTAVIEDNDGEQHTIVCGPDSPQSKEAVTIYQMRRVVNPKGIWRDADNSDPFHVVMMVQKGENSSEFEPLKSDGPWLAVIKNGDWFDLEPTSGKSQKNPDGTISGEGNMYDENNTGREIDFTFKPKGTASEPRFGLIKIYYNNYSCIHIIFVRQGYAPVAFYNSKTKWHSFNMKTATEEVSDPVLEGSYFRQFNTELPIAASNNSSSYFGLEGNVIVWKDHLADPFTIAGTGESKLWESITTTNKSWPTNFIINGKNCRLATEKDISEVIDESSTIYGYGVLYTDDTSETQTKVDDVYGAREGSTANKGMRGVFVCDTIKGTQIFLPIGATGYGRFKQKATLAAYNTQKKDYAGVNQYANRWQPMPVEAEGYGVNYKPLFWDLYRRPGAVYWLNNGNVIDINYYQFTFDITTTGNLYITRPSSGWGSPNDPSGSDAIQLRLVED